ncbi:MAG: hypothetical protein RSC93_05805 [Erysipelotrichaceae bacterium]
MKKKAIKFILGVILCFVVIPVNVLATSGELKGKDTKISNESWSNFVSTEKFAGSGTENDPYLIKTEGELAKLSVDVASGQTFANMYLKLESNLDLSAHRWNPIGVYKWLSNGTTINNPFSGIFDGNNKTISGLKVDERTDKNCAGLFGYISDKGVTAVKPAIKNLIIKDAILYSSEKDLNFAYSGILAGKAMAQSSNFIEISGVQVSGSITNESTNGSYFSGGMIGEAIRVNSNDCSTVVKISGTGNTGGFIGHSAGSHFNNCKASGMVSGTYAIGGFVGYSLDAGVNEDSTFVNCIAKVDVNGNNWRLGGFVGYLKNSTIEKSASYGKVTSTYTGQNLKTGGFVGENENAIIKKSYYAGKVDTNLSSINLGGFVGYDNNGTTISCMFDKSINDKLPSIGKTGVVGNNDITEGTTQITLSGICIDILGGHVPSTQWTTDLMATHKIKGSKSKHCNVCDEKTSITEIETIPQIWDIDFTIDIEPTYYKTGEKSKHCKDFVICGERTEITVIPKLPMITNGQEVEYNQNSNSNLTFSSNADLSDFISVSVDGKIIDKINYSVKSGSTIVELKAEYLSKLSKGKHIISINSTTGSASTTFTIKDNTPNTGDHSTMLLWLTILFLTGTLMITYEINKKHSQTIK